MLVSMKLVGSLLLLVTWVSLPTWVGAQQDQTPPDSWEVSSTSTACGYITRLTDTTFLNAVDVYNCLISTPFDREIATSLLRYWQDAIQFHSTLAYLKNPPKSYQQRPVDLEAGFDLIQQQIETGVFTNQYSFEVAVHQLLYSAHDGHVSLKGGVLGVFRFVNPFFWTSVSSDGFSLPEVYEYRDLAKGSAQGSGYKPSPVRLINGQSAPLWLSGFASRNAHGFVEPHAEWNQIMYTLAGYGSGDYDSWRSTVFYPGSEITVTFENGTEYPLPWMAMWSRYYDKPIINDGQDFYEYFVLGQDTPSNIAVFGTQATPTMTFAAMSATSAASAASAASATATTATDPNAPDYANIDNGLPGWGYAYPRIADVVQPQLGYGGVLTGYLLNDSKIGVLSIPSFETDPANTVSFSNTVATFLARAREAGMQKIVIDLQQNSGGTQLLATDTFRQFFPSVDPFSGMRSRTTSRIDVLGQTFAQCFDKRSALDDRDRKNFINSPWTILTELDARNGEHWESWKDFNGPYRANDDAFTLVTRYNLSNEEVVKAAADMPAIYGYGARLTNTSQPFDAKDIVMLTDGTCASTCDLFVEMMHHEAGVKTVAVGGVPYYGPMQARGGTRGALRYTSAELERDFGHARDCDKSTAGLFPVRPDIYREVTSLAFNVRDQIRRDEEQPLQFAYEAADCRIFFTPSTFNNFPVLWRQAAEVAFFNASTCVKFSDAMKNTMRTDMNGPSQEQKDMWMKTNAKLTPPATIDDINAIQDLIHSRSGLNLDGFEPVSSGERRCEWGCGTDSTIWTEHCYAQQQPDGYGHQALVARSEIACVCRPTCDSKNGPFCLQGFDCDGGYCVKKQTYDDSTCWTMLKRQQAPPVRIQIQVPNQQALPPAQTPGQPTQRPANPPRPGGRPGGKPPR